MTAAIKSYTCGPGFGTRGSTAYALRAGGMPWSEIVVALQANSDSAVVKVAKKHAEANGLPWPIQLPHVDEPEDTTPTALEQVRLVQKEAYDLRVAGTSWGTIREGRYSTVTHAVAGARRYAEREGLPWPIRDEQEAQPDLAVG